MRPIVRLIDPPPASPPGKLLPADWLMGFASGAVKSGMIAGVLSVVQAVDADKLTPSQAFLVGFVVLACTTLLRLYGESESKDSPGPPAGPTPPKPVSASLGDTGEFRGPKGEAA